MHIRRKEFHHRAAVEISGDLLEPLLLVQAHLGRDSSLPGGTYVPTYHPLQPQKPVYPLCSFLITDALLPSDFHLVGASRTPLASQPWLAAEFLVPEGEKKFAEACPNCRERFGVHACWWGPPAPLENGNPCASAPQELARVAGPRFLARFPLQGHHRIITSPSIHCCCTFSRSLYLPSSLLSRHVSLPILFLSFPRVHLSMRGDFYNILKRTS